MPKLCLWSPRFTVRKSPRFSPDIFLSAKLVMVSCANTQLSHGHTHTHTHTHTDPVISLTLRKEVKVHIHPLKHTHTHTHTHSYLDKNIQTLTYTHWSPLESTETEADCLKTCHHGVQEDNSSLSLSLSLSPPHMLS